jgi:hypothetical protein
MKKKIEIILLVLAIAGAAFAWFSIQKNKLPEPSEVAYGAKIEISRGMPVQYPDGLSIELIQVTDSRCPKEVQCIWAGEVNAYLRLSGSTFTQTKEISLGSITRIAISDGGYQFLLGGFRLPDTVMITVNKLADGS